ncbi:glutamyl-tRNA reductase [Apibacter mensalis]|uniref:Glutamyl-tRNA reductase n=1 Tax=Apibacter mensalis TaxID=1586267 RepID=A0A0X3AMD2_9FLAO|nr:glutamyl-tRNA reductase [Apibacter mensalis]CVK16339.1 glutamyl-tRNA reductase [Apibacter mensalis]
MKKLQPKNIKEFYAISLSYVKADTKIRGKYSFFPEFVEDFSNKINALSNTQIFVLSTCNRTELYFQTENLHHVIEVFCKQINVVSNEFRKYIIVYKGKEAIKHFLRVSAGLESQIIGDFEIISQIKTWFKRFKKCNCTNSFLERLINTGIQASKKIKCTTSISNGATSMSYAAVHYILKNFNQISEKKIVLIGTGKIGKNTCENLVKHIDNPNITLVNRTYSKAQEIAHSFNLNVENYDQMLEQVNNSDIVIVATGASSPIITKKDLYTKKPITLIDLSIPSNVCLSVNEFNHVTLLNVDDLSRKINETLEQRNKEIPKAEGIIEKMMIEFIIWSENRKYAPIIHAFKSDLERIKEQQIKTLKKDQMFISEKETELSNRLVQKITNRLANYLITNPEKADDTINLFKEMFQLQVSKL